MVMENLLGLMADSIKVTGKTESSMECTFLELY